MALNTAIEWATASWNPLAGCTPVSEGCKNCYAASMALRLEAMGQQKYAGTAKRTKSDRRAVFTGRVNLDYAALENPLRWRTPQRVFVNSMSDLFHYNVPDHFILEVFAMMERCPQHTFLVLTKRPDRMADWVRKHQEWVDYAAGEGEYLRRYRHVWVGTSCEDQQRADERIPALLRVPARVRFLSCEPLLASIDLSRWLRTRAQQHVQYWQHGEPEGNPIHWVIVGGESGPGARPMHPDWARSLRDQATAAGCAFFMKQWGEWIPENQGAITGGMRTPFTYLDESAGPRPVWRVGKKAAGRLLDGRTWDEFPEKDDL